MLEHLRPQRETKATPRPRGARLGGAFSHFFTFSSALLGWKLNFTSRSCFSPLLVALPGVESRNEPPPSPPTLPVVSSAVSTSGFFAFIPGRIFPRAFPPAAGAPLNYVYGINKAPACRRNCTRRTARVVRAPPQPPPGANLNFPAA